MRRKVPVQNWGRVVVPTGTTALASLGAEVCGAAMSLDDVMVAVEAPRSDEAVAAQLALDAVVAFAPEVPKSVEGGA